MTPFASTPKKIRQPGMKTAITFLNTFSPRNLFDIALGQDDISRGERFKRNLFSAHSTAAFLAVPHARATARSLIFRGNWKRRRAAPVAGHADLLEWNLELACNAGAWTRRSFEPILNPRVPESDGPCAWPAADFGSQRESLKAGAGRPLFTGGSGSSSTRRRGPLHFLCVGGTATIYPELLPRRAGCLVSPTAD